MVSTQGENGLSPQQEAAIIALVNETTVQKASAATGTPERTIYNWLKEPVFKRIYHEHRREAFSQAVALSQRYAPLAINTLAKVMADERAPHSARVSASRTLLEFGRTGIELEDLAARVEALENPAAKGEVSLSLIPRRIERKMEN